MFAPTGEDGLILRAKYGDRILGEDDSKVGITERTNAGKVLREGWDDVAFRGGLGDCRIARVHTSMDHWISSVAV